MILVDTSIWIDFFMGRDTPGVDCLEKNLNDEVDVFTTGIVVQEVLNGIKEKKDRDAVRSDLSRFILIMPSLKTHVQAAEIFDVCRKRGLTIRSAIDCLIAALAIEHGLALLENDRDYSLIAKAHPLRLQVRP